MSFLSSSLVVLRKELVDTLRDRRTLLVVLLSSVLMGPALMVVLSNMLASFEERAERRQVMVVGIEHAPGLQNFLERQSYRVKPAPADYEARLRSSKLGDAVLVLPERFEAMVLAGEQPVAEVVMDSGNRQAQISGGRTSQLVQAYGRERGQLSLLMRGVSPELLTPLRVEERDLASAQSRAAQFTAMLPFFVLMAVVYGAMNASLDTTAGERERASLEPLLMTPALRSALVLGKWGAAVTVGMLIALLGSLSFLPAQWLVRSDMLQAMFQFGLREALLFVALLLPLAATLSALLMAVAIHCKTFKEAQASTSFLVLGVSLLPLVPLFSQNGESAWHLWMPVLAQSTLMTRVLKGESLGLEAVGITVLVAAVLTIAGVLLVAHRLQRVVR